MGRRSQRFFRVDSCLLAAGHRVVALDLPAHGASEGTMASIPVCAESVLAVQRAVGRLHAVVGHSVGATIAAEAASLGLDSPRLVFLSAAARYEDYARRFALQAGLDSLETEEMLDVLEALGAKVRSVSLPKLAPLLRQRALFVHSKDDKVVPLADGKESAGLWPGGRFLEFDGLGHRGVLRSPAVLETVMRFLAE
jgi:pimeloyl-ACP methyl ester carboxylesterase